MKFLKQIVIDILMIPVIFEVGRKINKGIDLEDDKNLSAYAKWVSDLTGKV